jgi:hypothetical protein
MFPALLFIVTPMASMEVLPYVWFYSPAVPAIAISTDMVYVPVSPAVDYSAPGEMTMNIFF